MNSEISFATRRDFRTAEVGHGIIAIVFIIRVCILTKCVLNKVMHFCVVVLYDYSMFNFARVCILLIIYFVIEFPFHDYCSWAYILLILFVQ